MTLLALVVLGVVLVGAVRRPWGTSEAAFAVPSALLLLAVGAVSPNDAWATSQRLGPTVGFLAGILAFGHLCAEEGVFRFLGALAAQFGHGSANRLSGAIVCIAAAVTAVLTLDATVVLLTPVVLRTTKNLEVPPRPHLYACGHLANSGSLLLPVSNLTNLLGFRGDGVAFRAVHRGHGCPVGGRLHARLGSTAVVLAA